ncbi:MAG: hypothetical protein QOJ01_1811, partial [Solirubrobacterales bacterium]|nr:hypothetical protein [Solirubrobacterales bacterium]
PDYTLVTGGGHIIGLAATPKHLYWLNCHGTIGRAGLGGQDPNQEFMTSRGSCGGIAVLGQSLYWSRPGKGAIGRAQVDGTHVDQSFISGIRAPFGVAVAPDPARAKGS